MFSCYVVTLCFCGGKKIQVPSGQVDRWLKIYLWDRDYIFYWSCCMTSWMKWMIHHEIEWSMLLSLRVQMRLLSSIKFLCFSWRNDAVWFLYLVLKSFSVSPMYFCEVLLSLPVTVAYDSRQFPGVKWAYDVNGSFIRVLRWMNSIYTCCGYQ